MTPAAIALAIWTSLHTITPDAAQLARAIGAEARSPYEAALAAYYAAKESGVRIRPNAWSHDALAHESCGPWQLPCAFVATHTPREQVRYWLRIARGGGLVSLDSSPRRAWRRFAQAMSLLASVR